MSRIQYSPGEIAGTLLGSSAAIRELRDETALAARFGGRVMFAGEYGVGKRRIARIIHQSSVRCHAPFMTIRCADRREPDLERRLFGDGGHVRGALSRADGGTLLLEDVHALTPRLQRRLMEFLETGNLQPGSISTVTRPNVRIFSATTTRLVDSLDAGGFRSDLYYLLNPIFIPIPPLRERIEDVEPLLEFYTAYYARRSGCGIPKLSLESRVNCRTYDWPANLRQLQAAAKMFASSAQGADAGEILETAAHAARQPVGVRADHWTDPGRRL